MRALREVMRMYREGCLSVREIARLSGVARSTVRDMLAQPGRAQCRYRRVPDRPQ